MSSIHLHKYIAEAFGTFALATLVSTSMLVPGFPTPIIAALTLGLMVYIVGPISGTHINPAVTIGMWSVKKISTKEASYYIGAQVVGALLALAHAYAFYGKSSSPVMTQTASVLDIEMSQFLGEAVGAFLLTLGVASVVFKRVNETASGLVIGGSLLLGIIAASPLSLGFLNPAVAIGNGALTWQHILGPIVGAVLSALLFRYFHTSELGHVKEA